MKTLRATLLRLWASLNREKRERDMAEELESHLAMHIEDNVKAGFTPEEARRRALTQLGGMEFAREQYRAMRSAQFLESILQDIRYAVREIRRSPGLTVVATLILALGIGAGTALFSGVNGMLLRSIPVKSPNELVRFKYVGRNELSTEHDEYGPGAQRTPDGQPMGSAFSYEGYQAFLRNNQTMVDVVAGAPTNLLNVVVDGQAEIDKGFLASGNFYQVLGVPALLGRAIQPDDDRASAPAVAVISEGYWKRRFRGSSNIIGKRIVVNNVAVDIIGVTSSGFTGIQQAAGIAPDVTLPLSSERLIDSKDPLDGVTLIDNPTAWWVEIMGRVRPDVTAAQVQGDLEGVFQETARESWSRYIAGLDERVRSSARFQNRTLIPRLRVEPGGRGIYDPSTDAIHSATILSVVVGALLLIVCANVANLLLSRAAARRKEVSVRLSMGATRSRLIRQLLTESVMLAALGGIGGLVVGYWARQLLPDGVNDIPFDWRLFLFVAGLTLFTGIVFGTAPAFRATEIDLNDTLKESSRSVVGSGTFLSKSLLVVQVAMSLALLIGAGLFIETLRNLQHVEVGFNPGSLLLFQLNPQLSAYDQERTLTVFSQMLDRLRSTPGVQAVSYSQPALLSSSHSSTDIFIAGRTASNPRGEEIDQLRIAPGFFKTLGIPLVAGRDFTERDNAAGPKVAIINQAAARKFFGGQNPIGARFGQEVEKTNDYEIVGVVQDAKYNSLRQAAPPTVYFSHPQRYSSAVTFEVRTLGAPSGLGPSIRDVVRSVDANLPLVRMTTQAELMAGRMDNERFFARAYALFGGLALVLASIGLFGLMSYGVSRRTNEIGVRMALGAQARVVLASVLKESMVLVGIGAALGLGLAAATGRLVQSLLFGLAPTDPAAILAAVATLLSVSAIAGYIPARRAARVDPVIALHHE
jgi:predicted permease